MTWTAVHCAMPPPTRSSSAVCSLRSRISSTRFHRGVTTRRRRVPPSPSVRRRSSPAAAAAAARCPGRSATTSCDRPGTARRRSTAGVPAQVRVGIRVQVWIRVRIRVGVRVRSTTTLGDRDCRLRPSSSRTAISTRPPSHPQSPSSHRTSSAPVAADPARISQIHSGTRKLEPL